MIKYKTANNFVLGNFIIEKRSITETEYKELVANKIKIATQKLEIQG